MAHSVSAKKRIRQNETRRAVNRWRLRTMREVLKDLQEKLLHGSVKDAEASFKQACAVIDKTAGKGVIHKNSAARKKSRLSARLKAKQQAAS
ncbi:MAG: 30S ribosomal protein S20 [Phycisphaerales bacterium]|nr:MAG: 30S ribosomal protein S20 [Phycisphaerales bacterium]